MQDFGQILNKGLDYVRDTTSEYSVKTIILTVRHKSLDHLISSIFVQYLWNNGKNFMFEAVKTGHIGNEVQRLESKEQRIDLIVIIDRILQQHSYFN